MRVRIRKWGNGLGIRLPKMMIARLGLTEGAMVNLSIRNGDIVLATPPIRYALAGLLIGITPESMRNAFDWRSDIGREIVE
jgi:antitoxin MazE